jgi:hypothetical protein
MSGGAMRYGLRWNKPNHRCCANGLAKLYSQESTLLSVAVSIVTSSFTIPDILRGLAQRKTKIREGVGPSRLEIQNGKRLSSATSYSRKGLFQCSALSQCQGLPLNLVEIAHSPGVHSRWVPRGKRNIGRQQHTALVNHVALNDLDAPDVGGSL